MSMKPTGDQGQRYEVAAFGYPIEREWCVIGWAEYASTAATMAKAIALAPGCVKWKIRDRWNATPEWPGGEYVQMVGGMGLR